jgi:hypothetical protein
VNGGSLWRGLSVRVRLTVELLGVAHAAARDAEMLAAHLPPHFARPVDLVVLRPDPTNDPNTIPLPSGAMSKVLMAAPPLRRVSGLRSFVARSSSQKSCDGSKPCM